MDAGIMDKDGQLYVMAREDDVINVAGHRLSTAALEEALLEHPSISEAAVIGVPDVMKGELPLGLYVTTKGIFISWKFFIHYQPRYGWALNITQEPYFKTHFPLKFVANIKSKEEINKEVIQLVRELVGPVAAFKLVGAVDALPKTRSGKTARKSIADLARSKKVLVNIITI